MDQFTGRVVWFCFDTGLVTIHSDYDGELHDVDWTRVVGCQFDRQGRGGMGAVNLEDGSQVEVLAS